MQVVPSEGCLVRFRFWFFLTFGAVFFQHKGTEVYGILATMLANASIIPNV